MDEINLEARHYEQAFKFYFEDYPRCKERSKYYKQVIRYILSFNYLFIDFRVDEWWNDVAVEEAAKGFKIHELNPRDNLEGYLMVRIRLRLLKAILRKQRDENRYISINEIIKDEQKNEQKISNHLSLAQHPANGCIISPSLAGDDLCKGSALGERSAHILKVIDNFLGPLASRIYELSYQKGLTDEETSKLIRIDKSKFKNIRKKIRECLTEHKYDILTAIGITEDDLR